MTLSLGPFRFASLLLAGLVLSGCLPSDPRDEEKEPYFLAGKSRVNAMDYKGAIDSFEKALEVNPKSAPAHFELGLLYDQNDSDPAAAIYHFERFLKLSPKSGREEMVKTRIIACKQQLVQTVALDPMSEKQLRQLEKLVVDNKRLQDDLDKLRAYTAQLEKLTNQASAASLPARRVQPSAPSQPAASGASPSNAASLVHASVTPVTSARTHTVKAGDTPIMIARKYGVKLEALKQANPKLDARHLRVGQILTIPGP